jgi:ribosomal protein S18 acetylase RimI-like enzyme
MDEFSSGVKPDVIVIKGGEGALSLELMPLREGVARAFLRESPHGAKLTRASIDQLDQELRKRPYVKIIVQDAKRKLLEKSLRQVGWKVSANIPSDMQRDCTMVTTFDLPIDDKLTDSEGRPVNISSTQELAGISMNVSGSRKAWAFYTEDAETARIITEEERRQGMFVVSEPKDIFMAADCLVRFLAAAKKKWVVFSADLGRFIRVFDPTIMWRMTLEDPKPFEHSAKRLSDENKSALLRLFSEYYDESLLQSRFRLRRFRADKQYSIYTVDGGFVINHLNGETGLIYDIYVSPARQGQGLGTELMKCALTDFVGRATSVYLHTSYPRARLLYERFGFKIVHTQLGIRLDEIVLTPPRTV